MDAGAEVGVECWVRKEIPSHDLAIDMVADDPIMLTGGCVILQEGRQVTQSLADRLSAFKSGIGIQEPIAVRVPVIA